MGATIGKFFINVEDIPHDKFGFVQVCFLMLVYAYVLSNASNMISDGSELLLLVPALAGIVGSVVLPVLGAVPDGAIVLFSGLGPDAQNQLSVGVGALAGSTIMLLTIPWTLSVFAGRVKIARNGECAYSENPKLPAGTPMGQSGVQPSAAVARGGKIMIITSISYLLIQGPAFAYNCGEKDSKDCHGKREKYWALAGLITCVIFFIGYLYDQVVQSHSQAALDKIDEVRKKAISKSILSLRGVFSLAGMANDKADETYLLGNSSDAKRMRNTLKSFFHKYDHDKSGSIDAKELRLLLADLNEHPNNQEFEVLMKEMDTNNNGQIEFEEFNLAIARAVIQSKGTQQLMAAETNVISKRTESGRVELKVINGEGESAAAPVRAASGHDASSESDDDEEEEEVPDDLAHLSPEQQQFRIKLRAAWMMGLGTALVLLFSDPMVDVLSEFGNRIHVPPFYVAFVLAPLASNASELIASYNYALKKTRKTITISLTALQGAACMNNTFCLGIFLALIFFKSLVWEFSAETISIIFVQIIMVIISMRKIQTVYLTIIVSALYPISIAMVALIEKAGLN